MLITVESYIVPLCVASGFQHKGQVFNIVMFVVVFCMVVVMILLSFEWQKTTRKTIFALSKGYPL